MQLLIGVLVLACCAGLSTQQGNFCDPALCPGRGQHIACNGLTELDPSCGPGSREVPMTTALRNHILYLHNVLRNYVASGAESNADGVYFPQASRMPTLFWDDELAENAAANARRCVFEHDQCRNTWQFQNAGQNIAIQSGMSTQDHEELILTFVKMWYDEYKNANPSVIASYPSGWTGPEIGHFTQFVSDRTTRIGCSLVSYLDGQWTQYLFVCNYSFTNLIGTPVYEAGPTCSGCPTGCSGFYPGLCP